MYLRIVFNCLLIISVFLVQSAFVSGLPGWLNNINLIVIALIFILSIKDFRLAFWWAIGLSGFLEIYSFLPLSVYTISLTAALIAANFLLINVFTNRSLYSYLILSIVAIIIYEVFLYLLSFVIFYFLKEDFIMNPDKNFWLDKLSGIFVDIIVVVALFYLTNFISKNFKPVFLVKQPIIGRR